MRKPFDKVLINVLRNLPLSVVYIFQNCFEFLLFSGLEMIYWDIILHVPYVHYGGMLASLLLRFM